MEMARTSLNAANMSVIYYGEAIMYSVTVLNHLPRKRNGNWTAEEMWQGRRHGYQVYTKLQPFGCAAWALNLRPDRGKFEKKAILQIHLNYNPSSHSYRLLSIPNGKIIESAHVEFNTEYFPMRDKRTTPRTEDNHSPKYHQEIDLSKESDRPVRDRTPSAQALRNIASDG